MGDQEDEMWTEAEMHELIENVLANSEVSKKKFTAAKTSVEWEQLKLPGKSAESCNKAFLKMTSWVMKHMTVKDVVLKVKSELEKPKVSLDMVPFAPKRPITAFFQFSLDKSRAMKKSNPSESIITMSEKIKKDWETLTPSRREKYQAQYKTRRESYNESQALYIKHVPKGLKLKESKYITPFSLYMDCLGDQVSFKDAKSKFDSMEENKKAIWTWEAIQKAQNNEANCTGAALKLSGADKRGLMKAEGLQHKPVKRLFDFYKQQQKKGVITSDYKGITSNPADFRKLNSDHLKEMETYVERLSMFIVRNTSLAEDERQVLEFDQTLYKKLARKTKAMIAALDSNPYLVMKQRETKTKISVRKENVSDGDDDNDDDHQSNVGPSKLKTTPKKDKSKKPRESKTKMKKEIVSNEEGDEDDDDSHQSDVSPTKAKMTPKKDKSKKQRNGSSRTQTPKQSTTEDDEESPKPAEASANLKKKGKRKRKSSEISIEQPSAEDTPSKPKKKKSQRNSTSEHSECDSEVSFLHSAMKKKKKSS